MAEKALAVQEKAWTKEEIDVVRRTVAKDATDEELKMFLHLASAYNLDPFARDIWCVKMGDGVTITTSRDGYLKIANRNPHFKGYEADVVYEGDQFRKTRNGVEHVYGLRNRGNPVGAYAIIYRDDRDYPAYFFAPMANYRRNNQVWQHYPHAMILKVAEAMALKRAFSISGLVTQEELGQETLEAEFTDNGSEAAAPAQTFQPQPQPHTPTKAEYKDKLYKGYLNFFDGDAKLAQEAIMIVTEGRGSKDWTNDDMAHMAADLSQKYKARAAQAASQPEPEPEPEQEPEPMDKAVNE